MLRASEGLGFIHTCTYTHVHIHAHMCIYHVSPFCAGCRFAGLGLKWRLRLRGFWLSLA